MGLDTKTYWLTDRQSQCDFDFVGIVQFQMRRHEWSDSFSYEWIIVAAEAREQESELGLGAQKDTRGQRAKNWRVIRRNDLCVLFEVWDFGSFCVESRC
jgi:hypothetical protein